jgi:hypothetical protein
LRVPGFLVCMIVAALQPTLIATLAHAGEYHHGNTLNCSDCHSSHSSLSHDQNGGALDWSPTPGSHLTKGVSTTEMCLQCHDNQRGVPDVVGEDVNNPGEVYDGSERAGGHFPEAVADSWKGHDLPGQGDGPGECTACHDPHGNSNYRNLRALDGSDDGPVAFVNPSATGLDRYKRSNVGYAKNFGEKLCLSCHRFGASAGSEQVHRHPSSDETRVITIDATGRQDRVQHWVDGTGSGFSVGGSAVPRVPFAVSTAINYAMATTITSRNEVMCLSCHKAHGSVHAFGMLWPYGSNRDGLVSSSGCNQCHNVSEE